jgi:hypothetical protein
MRLFESLVSTSQPPSLPLRDAMLNEHRLFLVLGAVRDDWGHADRQLLVRASRADTEAGGVEAAWLSAADTCPEFRHVDSPSRQ